MIQYYFPYKNLIDENWESILTKYIPKFISSENELEYKLTVLELIAEINDTHANIWSRDSALENYFGKKIAPIEINFIENKPVIVRLFNQLPTNSKLNIGDIILSINGENIDSLIKEKIKYCPASNYSTKLRDVARKIMRTNLDSLNLTVENQEGIYNESVKTYPHRQVDYWTKQVPSYRTISEEIGYIYPGTLAKGEIDQIMDSYLDKKGIIIDLRCYPSDFIVFSLGKYLMPEPTEFVKFTKGSIKTPGLFTYKYTLEVGEKNDNFYKGRVVILINEFTQSNAEYTTMALRVAPNATVIGSTTAAADGNISTIYLPGNIKTMISGIGVYYPNEMETQRIGIIPDIEISPTINGIRNGNDEVLEKAIGIINL